MSALGILALNLAFAVALFVIKGRHVLNADNAPGILAATIAILAMGSLLPFAVWAFGRLARRRRGWPVRLHYATTILTGGALVFGAVRLALEQG